jgi:TolB-like protein
LKNLLAELQRRNVTRMAILYVVAAWLLLQVADVGISTLGLPDWSGRMVLLLLALGFPVALVFAWVYELTPEGIKRESDVSPAESVVGRTAYKLNVAIIVLLVIAIAAIALDRLVPGAPPTAATAATQAEESSPPAAVAAPAMVAVPMQAPVTETSIAVLPFIDMSPNRDNEYFSDGLTEELLNSLVKIRALQVAGRTSSFAYKGRDLDMRVIGEELGVAHLLEGSVRKAGDRLRITAQLIKVADGYHLWSETYDRELTDVFAIQSDIAEHVVEALQVTLLGEDAARMRAGGTTDVDAFSDYLQGIYLINKGSREDSVRAAVAAFDRALARDPAFVDAWIALGATMSTMNANAWESPEVAWARIEEAATEARRYAPQLAGGYMLESFLHGYRDRRWIEAIESMRRAVALEPGNANLLFNYSMLVSQMGLHEEGVRAAQRSVELEPTNLTYQVYLGRSLKFAGRCPEAEAVFRRVIERDPKFPRPRYYAGTCRYLAGDHEAALALFEAEPLPWMRRSGRPLALHKLGRLEEAQAAWDELIEAHGDSAAFQKAEIATQWGDKELAFRSLERAFEVRDAGLNLMLVSPLLMPLRDDPRYLQMLERVGLLHLLDSVAAGRD